MMRIETSVLVNRPIEEVWAFRTDLFNLPRLSGTGTRVLGMRKTSPGPMGVGTTVEGRAAILGVELRMSGVVTEWDPPRAATYAFEKRGPFRSYTVHQAYEATQDGTRVTVTGDAEVAAVMKPVLTILRPVLRRQLIAGEQKMKHLLEAGGG